MTPETHLVGFIGLGSMGEPMARNLAKAGIPLVAWNRSVEKIGIAAAAGIRIAASAADVFATPTVIILMLADGEAIDSVLERGCPSFTAHVHGRTIIHMGTTAPAYSADLAVDVHAAGGHYVEAPVSGSRKPAENGQLVAMLAGDASVIDTIRPLFAPMCKETIVRGDVPNALRLKLAVNLFLITIVTGLAEAMHFAERHGLDMDQVASVLNAGQMASDVSRVKVRKLIQRDFAKQAAISDVLKNNRLIAEAAREAGVASPLLDVCHELYRKAVSLGHGDADMVAVVKGIETRSRLSEPRT